MSKRQTGGYLVLQSIRAFQQAHSIAHSARLQTILLFALGHLLPFCLIASEAGAQNRRAATPLRDGLVRLPVIDKQDIRFTHVSGDKESFQNRVGGGITQDKYGFVWFGTTVGVYRYDGYNLKAYRRDPDDPNSLSEDAVSFSYMDRAGILWVGTGNGGLN